MNEKSGRIKNRFIFYRLNGKKDTLGVRDNNVRWRRRNRKDKIVYKITLYSMV